ncbi:MAG: hypothetical protein KAX38_07250 [Candidatus Krumholzibacteria bacterium]|nr:hypothetical protein [Candidatus Krumholzibacteria bacterium]
MKSWVELWVRLKVVDLIAQTASMTLTEKLEFKDVLKGLVRYSYWGMFADGADNEGIMGEVDRVIRMDSAFTNQNKHLYRLMIKEAPDLADVLDAASVPFAGRRMVSVQATAGEIMSKGDLALEKDYPFDAAETVSSAGVKTFAFDCLVRERKSDRETGFMDRLNVRLDGVAVSRLRAGEVWRIMVGAGNRDEALLWIEKMVVTRSRREGLFLNPHYQRFEIISSAGPCGWTEGEEAT